MSTEEEEQEIIEMAWKDFGAKGAAAAAIALVLIHKSQGIGAALWSLFAACIGVVVWMLVMRLLIELRGKSLVRYILRKWR